MPVCVHCNNRQFTNDEALRQHLKSSSAHPFCTPCNRHFKNEKAYEAHMAARHPPTFDCTKCNRTYRSQSSLEDHYRGSPAHPNCSRCGKGFKNKRLTEEHFQLQHAPVSCPCGPVILYFDELDAHYLASNLHPLCQTCNRGFKDEALYSEHLVSVHTDLYCAPCTAQFETLDALSEHHLMSPRHPTCLACCMGFKDDQEYSSHLSSVHAPSPVTNVRDIMPESGVPNFQRNSIPIKRPSVRIDSPALYLRAGFGSPLMDVKAPSFSPSTLPPPGGIIDDIWAMRQNSQAPGRIYLNGFSPVLEETSPARKKSERRPYSSIRDSLASIGVEPSPLSKEFVPKGRDADNVSLEVDPLTQLHDGESRNLFMSESDPIVPLERGIRTENAYKAIGTGAKDRDVHFQAHSQSSSQRSRASSSSVQSSSPPSSTSFHPLTTPTSPITESNALPFMVSSPVLSNIFHISESQVAEKRPDFLRAAMTTPIVTCADFELPGALGTKLSSVPHYEVFSPTETSSPDVSSPLDLSVLPSVSPLAVTPIERSRSDSNDIPEARCPLPESPSGSTSTDLAVNNTSTLVAFPTPDGEDADLSATTVTAPASLGSGSPSETSPVDDFYDELISPTVSDNLAAVGGRSTCSDIEDADVSRTASEGKLDLADIAFSPTTDSLISSMPTPATAAGSLANHPDSTSRLLHCRLCEVDMCNDPTATMCGHLFCYRCITEAVIQAPRCPVCMTPTLLYCLFRMDLTA